MDVLKQISKDVALRELGSLRALVKTVGKRYESKVIHLFSYLWKRGEILTQADLNNVVDLVHLAFIYTRTKSKDSALRIAHDVINSRSITDQQRKTLYKVFENASLLFISDTSDDADSNSSSDSSNSTNSSPEEQKSDEPAEDIRKVINAMVRKDEEEKLRKKQENADMRQVFAIAQKVFNRCGFEGTAPRAFAMALRPKLKEFGEELVLACAELFSDRNTRSQFTWKLFISQVNALAPIARISSSPFIIAKKALVEKLYNSLTSRNDRITADSYILLYKTPYVAIKRKIDELRTLQDARLLPRLQTIVERAYREFRSLPREEQEKQVALSKQLILEDFQKHKIPVPPPQPKTKNEPKKEKKEDKPMQKQNISENQQKIASTEHNVAPTRSDKSTKPANKNFSKFAEWARNIVTFIINEKTNPKTTPIDRENALLQLRTLAILFGLGPHEEKRIKKVLIALLSEVHTPRIREYMTDIKDRISVRLATSKNFKELATDLLDATDVIEKRTDLTDEDFAKVIMAVLLSSFARYLMLTKFPPDENDTKKPINQSWEQRKKKIEEYKQILHSLPTFEEKFNFVMQILTSDESKLKSAEEVLRK